MMMEGLATVGDADFPQTATNISGCGWSNDRGDWSIDTLADGALPENLHPPLCAARDVLNKYNAVVVRTVNLGKRKQADVEGPEEDTADQMFNEGIDAAARGQQLPDGWAFGKQIKSFPGFGGFLDDIRAGGAPSREPEQRALGTMLGLVMDDLLNLDTYGTPVFTDGGRKNRSLFWPGQCVDLDLTLSDRSTTVLRFEVNPPTFEPPTCPASASIG
jgi:hypothetical protein